MKHREIYPGYVSRIEKQSVIKKFTGTFYAQLNRK